jgi:hypothetical protein
MITCSGGRSPGLHGIAAIIVVAAMASGCATTADAFDAHGYRNKSYPYGIAYRDPNAKRLLGADWQLDNWSLDRTGRKWKQKTGYDYVGERTMDLDRDGSISRAERAKESIFDVKLVSRTTGAVIWAKAHPIHPDDAERKLDILLDGYADSLRGEGLYAQGSVFSVEREASRKYTTFVTERSEGTLSGSPMIAATIELAEVDRLQVRPDERSAMLRLVMIKYPYVLNAKDANVFQRICPRAPETKLPGTASASEPGSEPRPHSTFQPAGQAPSATRSPAASAGYSWRLRCHTVLVLGYYNTPQHFAEELPAFEQLLKQVSLSAGAAALPASAGP